MIPAAAEGLQNSDSDMVGSFATHCTILTYPKVRTLSQEVMTPHADVQNPESSSPNLKSHMNGTNILLRVCISFFALL